jgi:hypothetical protein
LAVGSGIVLAFILAPSLARAQPLPDSPDAGVPLNASPAVPAPPAPAPVPVTQAPVAIPAGPAPVQDDILAEVGARVAVRAQNPAAPTKLDDVSSEGEIDAVASGHVRPYLGWQAGFLGSYGIPGWASGTAVVLDLVAKVELAEALNLWVGRMPIPSDRASLSTAWSIAPWTMPGSYVRLPTTTARLARPFPGPRRGNYDRGDGATLWGQFWGGKLKYYAGAFGLDRAEGASPLLSARISLSLLDPEPGYRTSSSYYGSKDVFALGVSAQHQKLGSAPPIDAPNDKPDDFNLVSADAMLEKNGGSAGVINLEAASARGWGRNELVSYQFFVLASYLIPVQIGPGRFQPLLRYQHAGAGEGADSSDFTGVDAQLGYVLDGHRARLVGVYQYTNMTGQKQNAVLFGVQMWSPAK